MTIYECFLEVKIVPLTAFFVGSFFLAVLISRQENLGLLQTMLCLIGLKSRKNNGFWDVLHVLIIVAPIGLFLWLSDDCRSSSTQGIESGVLKTGKNDRMDV